MTSPTKNITDRVTVDRMQECYREIDELEKFLASLGGEHDPKIQYVTYPYRSPGGMIWSEDLPLPPAAVADLAREQISKLEEEIYKCKTSLKF